MCADGIVTSFFFSTRTNYPVRSIGFIRIQYASFIRTFGGFVTEYPDKASGKQRVRAPTIPKVTQSGTASLIVHGMHEFGRHKYFIAVGKTCHSGQISGIMVGVQIIEIGPRVYHVAFL